MNDLTAALAKELVKGSSDAWSQLYDAYGQRVWREVSWRLGGDSSDVGDVVQEVFMAAAKGASQFDAKRGTIGGWLSGIVRTQVALRYRKQAGNRGSRGGLGDARKWWLGFDGVAEGWLAGDEDGPREVLESKEMALLVRTTMLELSEDYQELLASRYFEGESAVAIGKRTGSNADAVRAKLMRARRAFRKAFLEIAGVDGDKIGEVLQ